MTPSKPSKPDTPTFEQALEQLESIVEDIEEGKVSLEESIERYGRGMELIKTCRSILHRAEQKIQLLAESDYGELTPAGDLQDLEPAESETDEDDEPHN